MSNSRAPRNLAEIRRVQINNASTRNSHNVLASLRATQIVNTKPVLPAELIATILEYVTIPDLIRCARASKRLQEIVYDDTRWIRLLKNMGAWNENEARQNFEDGMKRKAEAQRVRHNEELGGQTSSAGRGMTRRRVASVTLFDAGDEEQRLDQLHISGRVKRNDGFDEVTTIPASSLDPKTALTILDRARSIRGHARVEFGKIFAALNSFYEDSARMQSYHNPIIFKIFDTPEDQARILSALRRFARHDSALGHEQRQANIDALIRLFESAAIHEFEQGMIEKDVDGKMKRYAHVLYDLSRAELAVELLLTNHPLLQRTLRLTSPLDCLEDVATGHVDLSSSQRFFERLSRICLEQALVSQKVFPPTIDAMKPFLIRVCRDILAEYLTVLFDEAHIRGVETYVKAISGTFAQALQFAASLTTVEVSSDSKSQIHSLLTACFEKHIDLYLAEELNLFKGKSQNEVDHWEKETTDQQATAESYFLSNISRQAAKRDFLSSFKKVVMMPVNAFPLPFASSKATNRNTVDLSNVDTAYARSASPALTGISTPNRVSTPRPEAPTTELAAKTAIMNSRLEGIKSLFSIEVALNLTQLAKASLERNAIFVKMGGQYGEAARQQCEVIFVELLHILGTQHVKKGFDKAVEHLSAYDPRQVREYRAKFVSVEPVEDGTQVAGVEPLMTFLELVNVGDLIQQMLDVFYNEELLATKLTDRDDFLDPAVKGKKRFEQMLDERVAAGLSKGIDVLMDEVEFFCATTQPATDFNPAETSSANVDIGPSMTAKQIVEIVSSHTSMLVGTTDKTMLDVFMQEVGLRLFGVICKHIKRQRISVNGAIKLISDVNHYAAYINSLRQKPIQPYFSALRELGQIYLVYIDPPAGVFGGGKDAKRSSILSMKATKTQLQAKELATIIADNQRYYGIFPVEEVYEFAERRADWYLVKGDVERAMYGAGCSVM